MNQKHSDASKFDTLYLSGETIETVENMVSSDEEIRVETLEVEGLEIVGEDGMVVIRSSE